MSHASRSAAPGSAGSKSRFVAKSTSALSNVLSVEQLAELVDLFSVFDIRDGRGSGKMHCRDLCVASRMLGVEMSREHLQALATLYSVDGLHFTQDEFVEIASELITTKPEEEQKEQWLRTCFQLFDVHGSGVVASKQLEKIVEQLNAASTKAEAGLIDDISEEELRRMVKDLDAEGVGLTKASFVELLMNSNSIL